MKKLTLELCVDTSRAYEASTSQIAAIPDAVTVHRFRTSKPKPAQKQYKPNIMKCHFCGKQYEMLKSKCPATANGKTCNQKNNFSCSAKSNKKVNSLTDLNDDSHMINIVHYISDKAIFGKNIVNNKPVKIQIDCGASVNVLPELLYLGFR